MQCPRCEKRTEVLRTTPGAAITKRRRECKTCGHRFSTTEVANDAQVGIDARARKIMREAEASIKELVNR